MDVEYITIIIFDIIYSIYELKFHFLIEDYIFGEIWVSSIGIKNICNLILVISILYDRIDIIQLALDTYKNISINYIHRISFIYNLDD
jgi:hypothetical protein